MACIRFTSAWWSPVYGYWSRMPLRAYRRSYTGMYRNLAHNNTVINPEEGWNMILTNANPYLDKAWHMRGDTAQCSLSFFIHIWYTVSMIRKSKNNLFIFGIATLLIIRIAVLSNLQSDNIYHDSHPADLMESPGKTNNNCTSNEDCVQFCSDAKCIISSCVYSEDSGQGLCACLDICQ
mgnify:CR=1 FL=1